MPNVEEELFQRQQDEFEEQQQRERLAKLEEEQQQPKTDAVERAGEAFKNYAKGAAKKYAKEEALAAASTAGSAIVSTAPIWAPILGVILLVIGLGMFVIITFAGICNQGGVKGWLTRSASYAASYLPGFDTDVCGAFQVASGGSSGGAGGGAVTPPSEAGLVRLSSYGIPVKSGVDDRVTSCMAETMRKLYADILAAGLNIEISDAYRPGGTTASGGTSAHSRGEAVDMALRNPAIPWDQTTHSLPAGFNDPRIGKLTTLASKYYFPPTGNTLDEYHNPASNATAGHVHVEFNIPANGGSYCVL